MQAKAVRDALIKYSSDYLEAISTMQMIFNTKKEIGEMMSGKPIYAGQELPNGKLQTFFFFNFANKSLLKYIFWRPIFQPCDWALPLARRGGYVTEDKINVTIKGC